MKPRKPLTAWAVVDHKGNPHQIEAIKDMAEWHSSFIAHSRLVKLVEVSNRKPKRKSK